MSERTDLVLDETATQLDRILAALTPPTPPPPDPFADPTETVGVCANGDIIKFTRSQNLYEEIDGFDMEVGFELYGSINGVPQEEPLTEAQLASVKSLRIGSNWYPALSALQDTASSTMEWLVRVEEESSGEIFPNLTDLSMNCDAGSGDMIHDLPSISAITFMAPTNLYILGYMNGLKKIKVMSDLSVVGMEEDSHIDSCESLESFELPQTGLLKIKKSNSIYQWGTMFGDNVSLTAMTIPAGLNLELCDVSFARSIVDLTMEGRTMAEVQAMTGYPFGIGYQNDGVIHCSDGDIEIPSDDGGGD